MSFPGFHWPGAETQLWMVLAGGGVALAHWLYGSVWLRRSEWAVSLRELRGHRIAYGERRAIERDRSWADETALEKNSPSKSVLLGAVVAGNVWFFRDVPPEMHRVAGDAFTLAAAAVTVLWVLLRREVPEVGAPPKQAKEEPHGLLETLFGQLGAKTAHLAIAAAMLALAWRFH